MLRSTQASARAMKLSEAIIEEPGRRAARGRKSKGPTSNGEGVLKSTIVPYFTTLSGLFM